MVNELLVRLLRSVAPFRALVVGDFMFDMYTSGQVKRISPEAPVPILEVLKQESRPGGAGNVALNLAALGGEVVAVGRVGVDGAGDQLTERLRADGLHLEGFYREEGYQTPVKTRLIADSQQLLRVDLERIAPLSSPLEQAAILFLEKTIPTVQVVALSDYGKGFLTPTLLKASIEIARRAGVPLVVDPKGTEFNQYRGALMIKPNLSEAYAAAKLPRSAPLDQVAATLLHSTDATLLLITRSEAGMSLFDREKRRFDFPVRSKEVKDVTGAGDTVLAVMSMALANRFEVASAVQLANVAAGLSIERMGCVQVTLQEMVARLLEGV